MDKIQAKLDALKQSQQRTGTATWKWKPKPDPKSPKDSVKYTVRVLPNPADPDDPFIEAKFYYEFAKKTLIAPCTFGHPDPVLEFAEKLRSDRTSESWKLAKKIEPKDRYFAAVLVRGEEDKGPRWWDFSKTTYQDFLTLATDPDYTGYENLKDGRDITVEFTPAQAEGTFPSISLLPRPKTTPATTDKEVLNQIREMKPVFEYYVEPTYDELVSHMENYFNGTETTSEPSKPTPAAKSNDVSTTTKSDVDDAFDELFNQN